MNATEPNNSNSQSTGSTSNDSQSTASNNNQLGQVVVRFTEEQHTLLVGILEDLVTSLLIEGNAGMSHNEMAARDNQVDEIQQLIEHIQSARRLQGGKRKTRKQRRKQRK